MSKGNLAVEAENFVKSSAFRYGDATGFSINLCDGITLPGRCSPGAYLDRLGLGKLPEKVMVVCAGNGGLAVECFARGAKVVVAVEPRSRFNKGIQGVKRLLDAQWRQKGEHGLALIWHPHWPTVGRDQGLKNFDLILWPEGVEESSTPKATFQSLADCLATGGKLVVELALGKHGWVEKINSWRPTGHAVNEMAAAVFDGAPTRLGGRNATSKIYTLTLPMEKVDSSAAAASSASASVAAAAEKKAAKKVDAVAAAAEKKAAKKVDAVAAAAEKKAAKKAAAAAAKAELLRIRAESETKLAKALAESAVESETATPIGPDSSDRRESVPAEDPKLETSSTKEPEFSDEKDSETLSPEDE